MFDTIATGALDSAAEQRDIIRRLQRELGQARLAVANPPLSAQVPAFPPVHIIPAASARWQDLVLAAAESEWRRPVTEPVVPGDEMARIIDGYIRSPLGLGWGTVDYHTWKPGVAYQKNLDFAWCGALAAWCYGHAGCDPKYRRDYFSGTDRLWAWAKSAGLLIPWEEIQPADIPVWGADGHPAGSHITLARTRPAPDGTISLFEGNAVGLGPTGRTYEGVVAKTRARRRAVNRPNDYSFKFALRPPMPANPGAVR